MVWVRRRWHWFDGYCAERGVDPLELPSPRFLNLVHHVWVSNLSPQDEQERQKVRELDASLTGSLTMRGSAAAGKVDNETDWVPAGMLPAVRPSWF